MAWAALTSGYFAKVCDQLPFHQQALEHVFESFASDVQV
jgi:hypothetical protein